MPTFMENALSLAPSYLSSFFPPNVGKTKFSHSSAYTDFLSDAGTNGYGMSYRFLTFIESPWLDDNFKFKSSQMDKRLTLRAFSVNVPSKYFSTLDRDIAGPKRRIPYTGTFDDDLTMQFYCSPDMAEYGFMQKWMDGIVDPVTRYVSFYDDFAKNTAITLVFIPNTMKTLDQMISAYQAKKLRGIRFTEAFPRSVNVNGGTVEWSGNNKPTFTNVSFAFREAVDLTTYDERVKKAMRELESINADIRGEMIRDQWDKEHPEDLMAIDGLVKAMKGNSEMVGEAEHTSKMLDHANTPAEHTPIADQGRVVNFTPPPGTFSA